MKALIVLLTSFATIAVSAETRVIQHCTTVERFVDEKIFIMETDSQIVIEGIGFSVLPMSPDGDHAFGTMRKLKFPKENCQFSENESLMQCSGSRDVVLEVKGERVEWDPIEGGVRVPFHEEWPLMNASAELRFLNRVNPNTNGFEFVTNYLVPSNVHQLTSAHHTFPGTLENGCWGNRLIEVLD